MALFGKKKEEKVEKKEEAKEKKAPVSKKEETKKDSVKTFGDLSWVLKKPRITEKATITPEIANAYVFEIDPRANKDEVKAAVKETYKVDPVKVNIAKIKTKKVERRSRKGVKRGSKAGGKKAYIYLKKGDTIEFV